MPDISGRYIQKLQRYSRLKSCTTLKHIGDALLWQAKVDKNGIFSNITNSFSNITNSFSNITYSITYITNSFIYITNSFSNMNN